MRIYLMETAVLITTCSMEGDHHCYAFPKSFQPIK